MKPHSVLICNPTFVSFHDSWFWNHFHIYHILWTYILQVLWVCVNFHSSIYHRICWTLLLDACMIFICVDVRLQLRICPTYYCQHSWKFRKFHMVEWHTSVIVSEMLIIPAEGKNNITTQKKIIFKLMVVCVKNLKSELSVMNP